ncbi:unnamed protein product [Trichogramma brassicae]|uniref:Superoxide dismutase copper/zinc binding domain-containing protein n=1 Tax=Trichogramma brassicae TaxID=86971 RepID=A0A6H5HVH7_9HYME|nr:unnamed protein product [Trichogramma brassicae]
MNRRKAVAKNWFGNGEESKIAGKLEFIQESPYDVTDVEVHLEGLETKMSGYHVHMTPVEIDLEFPCDDTTLYGHWNPLGVDPNAAPPPTTGSSDQYELGDLSGKFGTLDGRKHYDSVYNDTQLPLFGPRSIIGRSIVVHKKEKNLRWACTTIERGYSPAEAREIRAIASFHHPNGFAYGYIRMTQLIYKDGSQSDTVIEVNLRHPGKYNTNVTRNHNWAIYVNPVGVDATVKVRNTRCVAGGYRWNPYFTQLADPLNVSPSLLFAFCTPLPILIPISVSIRAGGLVQAGVRPGLAAALPRGRRVGARRPDRHRPETPGARRSEFPARGPGHGHGQVHRHSRARLRTLSLRLRQHRAGQRHHQVRQYKETTAIRGRKRTTWRIISRRSSRAKDASIRTPPKSESTICRPGSTRSFSNAPRRARLFADTSKRFCTSTTCIAATFSIPSPSEISAMTYIRIVYKILMNACRFYKSLNTVRWKHSTTSARLRSRKEPGITHRDMVLTQFGFVGYVLLSPGDLSLTDAREDREAFNHFWRVTGHLLGIPDEYD